jgi:site-specific recombinase XerD
MPKRKDCSFFLKEPKAATPTFVYFHMTLPDGKIKRSIGLKVLPTDWDLTGQRAAGKGKPTREINQVIDSIINMLPGLKSECRRNNRVISSADVHAALDVILQDKRPEKEKPAVLVRDMFTDFDLIIQGMKEGTVLTPGKTKKRYKAPTIKNYEKSVRKLRAFYEENKLPPAYTTVTIARYNEFLTWCHAQNQSNNSIGVFIKCWKRLGKIAFKADWHTNRIFEDEDFVILKEDTEDIYLDESKIQAMYNLKLPVRYYDIARDWFVLDCYLGLRVGDLQTITMADFAGEFFQFVNSKTGAHVAIKINRFVKAIIKKWKGLPPAMSDIQFNKHIKEVAKAAKLNKKFIYRITKGGVLVTETLEEWEMVSSHTCRRSFITNLLKMGEPHARVMKLAGIKRYETLMKYFKETVEEVAHESGKSAFFK